MATNNNALLFQSPLDTDDDKDSQDPRMIMARSLMRAFEESSRAQNMDPVQVAEERMKTVPLGRRLLADFLVGFSNSFAGTKLQTVREQLVNREIMSQQLKAQQAQRRTQMLQAQIRLFDAMAPDQKQQALNRLVQNNQITQEDADRAMAGVPKPEAPKPPASFEAAAVQAESPEEFADVTRRAGEFAAAKRAPEVEKPEPIGTPFQESIKAFERENDRKPSRAEIRMIERSLDKPKEESLPAINKIPRGNDLGRAAHAAALRLAPQLPGGRDDSLAASIKFFVDNGDRKGLRDTLKNTAISALPAQMQTVALSRPKAIEALDRMEETMNKILAKPGGEAMLGKIGGSIETMAQRMLGATTDPSGDLAALAQQFQMAVFDYVRAQSGAQTNENEFVRYSQSFPSLTNAPNLNRALINNLRNMWTEEEATFLKTTLGEEAYNTIFLPQVGEEIEVRGLGKGVVIGR